MSYIPPKPNGINSANNATPGVLPVLHSIGSPVALPALNYEFFTQTTDGWYDALGYNWLSITIICSAAGTGQITLETANNTSFPAHAMHLNQMGQPSTKAAQITPLTTTRHYEGPINGRYIRARVSTAFGTATVTISFTLRQIAMPAPQYMSYAAPLPAGTNNLGGITADVGNNLIGSLATFNTNTTDLSSVVTTTNTTSSVSSTSSSAATHFALRVTAATGTTPTLDFVIQESLDNTNFFDLYHFERITATGLYTSPTLRVSGAYLRYIRTVGGTSPSFTITLTRMVKSSSGQNFRSYYDRSLTPSSGTSVTPAYYAHGCNQFTMTASSGAASSGCSLELQGSYDKSAWFSMGSALATSANSTTSMNANNTFLPKWIRAAVSSTGSGQTLNYVHFSAAGP